MKSKSIIDIISQYERICLNSNESNWEDVARSIAMRYIWNIKHTEFNKTLYKSIINYPHNKSDGKVCKKYIKEFEALNRQYFKTKVSKDIYMRPTERVWVVSVDKTYNTYNMYTTHKVFRNQQTAQDYYTDLLLYYPSAKVRICCEGEETMDYRPFRKSF